MYRGRERRTSQRHASDLVASYHPLALPKKSSLAALVHDVSDGGMSLVVRYRFEPGTALAIYLGDGADEPVLARVVRVSQRKDGKWLLGCALNRPLSAEQLRHSQAGPGHDVRVRVSSAVDSFNPINPTPSIHRPR